MELFIDTLNLEQGLFTLDNLDEEQHDSLQQNEAMKLWSKPQYDCYIHPSTFRKGDFVLVFNTCKDSKTRPYKSVPKLFNPFIIQRCLLNGAYVLQDLKGVTLNMLDFYHLSNMILGYYMRE